MTAAPVTKAPPPTKPATRRSWLRISLRAALLVVTVICIALAAFYNRLRQQERAVRAIDKSGGIVAFDYQFAGKTEVPSRGPAWLRKLVGDECFRTPVHVELRGKQITDELLAEILPGLRPITVLKIESRQVTDGGLASLASLSNVTSLTLDCPQVTDAGLQHVASLTHLEFLQLYTPQVTDAGLAQLAQLQQLKGLTLAGGKLTPTGLAQLAPLRSLTALTCLRDWKNARLIEMLDMPAPCEFTNIPLIDALQMLAGFYRTTIDDSAITGTSRLLPTTEPATTQPLTTTLAAILKPAGLGYYLDQGTLKIVPASEADAHSQGERAAKQALPNAKLMIDW